MDGKVQPMKVEAMVAALDWWRDAGVDLDFGDEPVRWLTAEDSAAPILPAAFAGPARTAQAGIAKEAQLPAIGGDPALWPANLADFATWWLNEPSLDGGQVRGRVPPRGPAGAECMVLVAQPSEDDADILLEGREGAFLASMLAAMGFSPGTVYLAAALPRRTPVPDWSALAAGGLGKVLAHHIGLVAPKRVIVFGSGILPLLGHDPAQNAKNSRTFNHGELRVPLFATLDLGVIADRPARKARLWQSWLEFTGLDLSGPGSFDPENTGTATA